MSLNIAKCTCKIFNKNISNSLSIPPLEKALDRLTSWDLDVVLIEDCVEGYNRWNKLKNVRTQVYVNPIPVVEGISTVE